MKKGFIFVLISLFLVACSSDSDANSNGEEEDNQVADNEEEVTEEVELTTEVLYTYEHEDSGDYSLQGLQADSEGKAIVFTAKEDIDRSTEYFTYFIDQNNEVVEGRELALEEDQERRCTDLSPSPNGDYLVYDCHDDDIEFSIYDMEKGETIYQIPESDDLYVYDILGISNDLTVYLETNSEERQTQLTLLNAETDTINHYELGELLEEEYPSFNSIIPTDDGGKILIDIVESLYLFDTKTEEVSEIVSVDSYREEHDNDDIFIYNPKLSPDGKYLYYRISENNRDPVYRETFFHNLESGEITAYGELDYSVRNFDLNGNLLLHGDDQLYIYNLENEEKRVIPELTTGVYTKNLTLAKNGEFLIYTDKESNEDDTYTEYVYRVSLGDISAYETAALNAQEEREREEVAQDEITLYNETFDEVSSFQELWESSTNILFPTEFAEEVTHKTNHYRNDPSEGRYSQTIFFDTNSSKRDEIGFTAQIQDEDRSCPRFGDLEVVDTVDGNDYYFYDYNNSDVEAGVRIDNTCYFFDAEDHTQDEMMMIAQSLEPIDDVYHEIPVNELMFPTLFPMENPEITQPVVISYRDGETVDYLINYRGDNDNDIDMDLEIRNSEPNLYMNEDYGSILDIDGWDEAFLYEDRMKLYLYNGTHYYIVALDISNDMLDAFGLDHVQETFIEIGKSIE